MTATLIKYALVGNGTGTNPTGPATGDLAGSYPAPTISKITGTSLCTGEIFGFPIYFGSTSTIKVGFPNANSPVSVARDKADVAFLTLAAATQYTISTSTHAAALGDDSFTGTGTVSCSTSTVTGSGTSFLTAFGTRALTGTCSNSSTTITGTGTNFTTELAVGDLIGNATAGYASVTTITSDTSLVVSTAITLSSASVNCIENPSITFNASNNYNITAIASNTSLTIGNTATIGAGTAFQIGRIVNAASNANFCYVWIASGGSGNTAYVSTQRTTPYGVTGYTTSIRMIGAVLVDSSGNVLNFSSSGTGNIRNISYLTEYALLSAGTATTETLIGTQGYIPPIASRAGIHARFWNSSVGTSGLIFAHYRWLSGSDYFQQKLAVPASTLNSVTEDWFMMPNAGQRIFYLKDANPGATVNQVDLLVTGYEYNI